MKKARKPATTTLLAAAFIVLAMIVSPVIAHAAAELFDAEVSYQEQNDGSLKITKLSARVRNLVGDILKSVTVKVFIQDPGGRLIDSGQAYLGDLSLSRGDVQRREGHLAISGVPRGFKWTYEIVGTYYDDSRWQTCRNECGRDADACRRRNLDERGDSDYTRRENAKDRAKCTRDGNVCRNECPKPGDE